MNKTIISFLSLITAFSYAEEPVSSPIAAPVEMPPERTSFETPAEVTATFEDQEAEIAQKVLEASEAIGVLMAKSIPSLDLKFDTEKVVQGFKEALQGQGKLKSEMECVQAIAAAQEAVFKEMAAENLKRTEEFFAKNKTAEGVKELEANKLQYKIEKEGTGEIVENTSTPIVRYTAKFIDETVEDLPFEESRIDLTEEELIPGFKQALLGMKEGEKRIVYIHPDLAFKTKEYNKHTNSLLTFEIEIIQANAPAEKPLDSLSTPPSHSKRNPEIAEPFEEHKAVR